jgi:hypothetical protein
MKTTESLDLRSGSTSGPVECLGQTFPSDQERREHYLKLLAEKLKDPEFRKQEGFPQGTDEAILAMSDPPYYTACPNPWLADFVKHYGKPYDPRKYSREPLAIDVSVGKTDPSTRRILTTPRCRTWPSCRRSCTTPGRVTSCWMALPDRA